MRVPRRIGQLALGVALVAAAGLVAAPTASAATKPMGTKSLAEVLTSDGNQFDRNWSDYDIVTEAVLAVLKAKPKSAVGVLADGKVALTAFVPTDRAFRNLVADLTGKTLRSEKDVFAAVAGLGIDTVETVLLYHVVPGATIEAKDALKANKVALKTAQGGTFTVRVKSVHPPVIWLKDADPNDKNPIIVAFDINKGNKQIAHGISEVLRPVDL